MTTISVSRPMPPLLRRCGLPCGLLLALAGCGTPQPVRDLASVSAANVSVVSSQLQGFSRSSEQVAAARAKAMVELDRQVTAARKELALKRLALEKAGQSAKVAKIDELADLLADLQKVEQEGLKGGKPLDEELMRRFSENRNELLAPVEPLTASAKALSDLASDDDFDEKVRFYAAFIQSVAEDITAAKAEQDKASADAMKAISKTSASNASPPSPTE
jgi:hypothetical protein